MIEKDLDGLADGELGCSIEDGKAIMKEVQKIIVERQLDLWVRYCRACPTCDGLLPIKDYNQRKILTVFGEVTVRFPRLVVCQKCNPACCFSTAPAEASVNRLVAKRFVKKQQMRWSRTGAHYLLKVRASVLNGDLSDRTQYKAPKQPIPGNIASFIARHHRCSSGVTPWC